MTARLSSPALRTLLVEFTREFLALNSAELPDGATLYDSESHTLWRLNKLAGDDFDDLDPTVLVKPNDQTEGRWFAEDTIGGSPYQFSGYAAAAVAVTMTSNQWHGLGSTAGTFAVSTGSASGLFTQSTTTGIVTYNGPARLALVTMSAAINNGIGATGVNMHAAISVDGDVQDGSTTAYPEKGEMLETLQAVASAVSIMTVRRIVLLTKNVTLQMMFRNSTNGDDIVVNNYQVTIEPI
jgi:hypothetical protein